MIQDDFSTLSSRLSRLTGKSLGDKRLGLEKESLRVRPDGSLASSPHPPGLGSALTHPWITTDYSESLMELVTPPSGEPWSALQCLVDLHQFVYQQLGDEMLWATSMPCSVSSDDDIPLAWYGSSNVGMMKHVYRRGLGYRYGRLMQAIAGVHFNFSVGDQFWDDLLGAGGNREQDTISAYYFGLLRNFRRHGWLTLYLFGASPAVCRSFIGDGDFDLEEYESTVFHTYATSLRMSDLGYKNKVQSRLEIPVNNLQDYLKGLVAATNTPFPDYQDIGVVVDGEYRQLNANILQIENEYYSLIRPKRVAFSGEKPSHALQRAGVEYVEVRACDLNPFDPAGVNQAQLRFLEMFVVFCLLHDSPPISDSEQKYIDHNQLQVARRGRDPQLQLDTCDGKIRLRDWALNICDGMQPVAALFDASGGDNYRQALRAQQAAIEDPDLTPSARVLAEMREGQESFFEFAQRVSAAHRDYYRELVPLSEQRAAHFEKMARQSHLKQEEIEKADTRSFSEFLDHYFAQ